MSQKPLSLLMVGNAHIDPVWLWRWQEGFHEVLSTFRSALDRMVEYDDFSFVSSSAAFFEWVERVDPAMFAEIQQRVAEGRWQLVGGWWIEPDCNLPCGESFARQGLYGQRYFKEKFGLTARVGYNVDSFGHSAMLPQILKKSGLDYYIFMRPMPHEKGLPGRLFWWEADDGSRVLAYRLPYEYCTWGKGLEGHIQRCAAELKAPLQSSLCFYGVGNHGGGPTRENLDSIRRMNADPEYPALFHGSIESWFDHNGSNGYSLPVVHDDLQHHASGCYAAHSGVKRSNRKAEVLLTTAEKFAALAAWTTGQPYPRKDFTQAWKNVLFNQFHDILAGTSVESAYEDARDLYGEAASLASRGMNDALQSLAWRVRIDAQEGMTPIVVFNPHAWESRQVVELEFGGWKEGSILVNEAGKPVPVQVVQSEAAAKGRTRLCFVARLPTLGYRTYRILSEHESSWAGLLEIPLSPLKAGPDFLENSRFRLEFDSDSAVIRRLYDKQAGAEVFCGPAAVPVVLDDASDTWGHNVFSFNRTAGVMRGSKLSLVECGAVRAVLRLEHTFGASSLIQDFVMYRDLDPIEVRVRVDWRETFKALKLRFPVNVSHMRLTCEVPYGHIERFANGEEEPGQSWIDLSGMSRDTDLPYGFSLLNDGKYSFDVNVRDIGLTILRSPIYAHHMPVEPDPEASYSFIDHGIQRFSYTLYPHQGSWERAATVQRAAELNQPPVPLIATYHPNGSLPQTASFLCVDRPNVSATVLKMAEEGDDLILRCVETNKEAVQAAVCLPFWNRVFEASFGPCEIKTFRIPRDPEQPVVETNLLEWEK
jgi:alpha-mannosidase